MATTRGKSNRPMATTTRSKSNKPTTVTTASSNKRSPPSKFPARKIVNSRKRTAGKENLSPVHKKIKIDEATQTTVPTVAAKVNQLQPDPYEEITESIFCTQIKDGNDYGGVCFCEDGECGVSCVSRYLLVECGRSCPSGEKCTNRAMQKKGGAKVEVYHTGSDKGFGVRTLEPIKKGAFIVEYLGEVVSLKASEKRKKLYAKQFPTRRHHYLMAVTDSKHRPFIIDATKYGNSSRFLNHSCEPNAFCDKWSVQRRFRMGFYAKRDIEAGEEITYNYGFQNYGRELIDCMCGASSCTRYLSTKEQAKVVLSFEMIEKEFEKKSEQLLKRYVKSSMFSDVGDFKKTLRKILQDCIKEENKRDPLFAFALSTDVKHRMIEYTKNYVQKRKLNAVIVPRGPRSKITVASLQVNQSSANLRVEFKKKSEQLLKRYVKSSMFSDVGDFKKTLRKILQDCIKKENKLDPLFNFALSTDVKHRMIEYTKNYVQKRKLKAVTVPRGPRREITVASPQVNQSSANLRVEYKKFVLSLLSHPGFVNFSYPT